jgi:hypothetical protein
VSLIDGEIKILWTAFVGKNPEKSKGWYSLIRVSHPEIRQYKHLNPLHGLRLGIINVVVVEQVQQPMHAQMGNMMCYRFMLLLRLRNGNRPTQRQITKRQIIAIHTLSGKAEYIRWSAAPSVGFIQG